MGSCLKSHWLCCSSGSELERLHGSQACEGFPNQSHCPDGWALLPSAAISGRCVVLVVSLSHALFSFLLRQGCLITVTGQDSSYLAELLLEKGYQVHGIDGAQAALTPVESILTDPHEEDTRLVLHCGDLTDSTNLIRIIQRVQPDEIITSLSHVAVSFESGYTANSDALGTLRILEAVGSWASPKKLGSGEHQ